MDVSHLTLLHGVILLHLRMGIDTSDGRQLGVYTLRHRHFAALCLSLSLPDRWNSWSVALTAPLLSVLTGLLL